MVDIWKYYGYEGTIQVFCNNGLVLEGRCEDVVAKEDAETESDYIVVRTANGLVTANESAVERILKV